MYTSGAFEYTKFLRRNGFEHIGSGSFCSAYRRPEGNVVVKVSDTGDCTKTYSGHYSDGFEDYVDFLKNEDSMHGLKIFNFRRFNVGLPSEFYVSVAEYLPDNVWNLGYVLTEDYSYFDKQYRAIRDSVNRGELVEEFFSLPKTLQGFFVKLKDFFGDALDLHGENIRWRGNTMVFIDPVGFI